MNKDNGNEARVVSCPVLCVCVCVCVCVETCSVVLCRVARRPVVVSGRYLVSLRRMVLAVPNILGGAHPGTGWGGLIITGIHPISFSSLPLLFFFFLFLFLLQSKETTRALQHHRFRTESILLSQRDHRDNNSSAIPCLHTFDPTKIHFCPVKSYFASCASCFGHLVSDSGSGPRVPNTTSPLTINSTHA